MTERQVVVVEDNGDIRDLIGYVLDSKRYTLKLLESASAFDRHMAEHAPDVIILDVMLPDGNGLEMCRRLKENPLTKHIPVVLMSANIDEYSGEAGAETFISKPFDIDDFKQKIEYYLV